MATQKNIIAAAVAAARKRAGLTQDQLSVKLQLEGWDIERLGLSKIERGVRCVAEAEAYAIAKALHVSLDSLFPDAPTMKSWLAEQSKRNRKK